MLLKLSQHLGWKVSTKVRVMVVTCFMALFVVGLQQAEAQKAGNFPAATDALEVLNVEIGDLLAAKSVEPASPTLENPVEGLKVLYYKGIALRLKEGMTTQDAIETAHSSFVALAPQVEAEANILKTQATDLLEQ